MHFLDNLEVDLGWLEKSEVGDLVKNKEITVLQTVYFNEDTLYGVYSVEDEEGIVFLIQYPNQKLIEQQKYVVEGEVTKYKGEKQVTVSQVRFEMPTNELAIIYLLKQIKGINQRAELLFREFGSDVLDVLRHHPERIADTLKGVGLKSAKNWQEQFLTFEKKQFLYSEFFALGFTEKEIKDILFFFGEDKALEETKKNPYQLISQLERFGFLRADRVAMQVGILPSDTIRIKYAFLYILQEAAKRNQHTALPKNNVLGLCQSFMTLRTYRVEAERMLKEKQDDVLVFETKDKNSFFPIERKIVKEQLEKQKNQDMLTISCFSSFQFEDMLEAMLEENMLSVYEEQKDKVNEYKNDTIFIMTKQVEEQEKDIVSFIMEAALQKNSIEYENEEVIQEVLKINNIQLEDKQLEAVRALTKHKSGVYLLNGKAGTGKTFTINIVMEVMRRLQKYHKAKFLAPTGRAAKVLRDAVNQTAYTVHRHVLENFTFTKNDEEKPYHTLVVDEFGMCDLEITSALLKAENTDTKVIFLGDEDQLLSVGAGNVLLDIMKSGKVEVLTLDVSKRQEGVSGNHLNAQKILKGEMIESFPDKNDSFVLFSKDKSKTIKLLEASVHRLHELGYEQQDIQVLAPQWKGMLGIDYLNYHLQQLYMRKFQRKHTHKILNKKVQVYNPVSRKKQEYELYFEKGDKVFHRKNEQKTFFVKDKIGSYKYLDELTLVNGEIGEVEEIYSLYDEEEEKIMEKVIVKYDDGYVAYAKEDLKQLEHAYVLTIHKSQGSEWPAVIGIIGEEHGKMLNRSLVYTLSSRAKKFGCFIGSKDAIWKGIQTMEHRKRCTTLVKRLQEN